MHQIIFVLFLLTSCASFKGDFKKNVTSKKVNHTIEISIIEDISYLGEQRHYPTGQKVTRNVISKVFKNSDIYKFKDHIFKSEDSTDYKLQIHLSRDHHTGLSILLSRIAIPSFMIL